MATYTKLPSNKWRCQVRLRGVSKSATFPTKAMAVRWGREQETEIEAGRLASHAKDGLLGDLFDRYEAEITSRKRGQQAEQSRLKLFQSQWGETNLSELTTEVVFGFAQERLLQGLSSDSVRRDLALLSSFFGVARDAWGYGVPVNPAQVALKVLSTKKLLRKKKTRVRRLQPGEYRRLLRGLRDNPRMRLLVRIAIETGLRRGELLRLRPDHLRPEGLWVPDDKTEANAVIPLTRRARQLIGGLPTEGFGYSPDAPLQALARACARVGIEDLRLHDLRHEAISRLFDRGLNVAEVALISRHSDWRSLKVYSHLDRARVVEKLG